MLLSFVGALEYKLPFRKKPITVSKEILLPLAKG